MGSIVQQILSFLPPDHETVAQLGTYFSRLKDAPLGDEILQILCNTLPRHTPIFVILDGMDECSEQAASAVLSAVRSISIERRVHICCSTHTGTVLCSVLVTMFAPIDHHITLTSETISSDLKSYVEAEIERRRHIRHLEPSLEAIVKDVLVKASDGM
jgi:archaellum biogenesis ATPase FlaH